MYRRGLSVPLMFFEPHTMRLVSCLALANNVLANAVELKFPLAHGTGYKGVAPLVPFSKIELVLFGFHVEHMESGENKKHLN